MLGPEIDLEMRQYVRDGAHYVPTVTQVAFEEQQWSDQLEASVDAWFSVRMNYFFKVLCVILVIYDAS